MIRFRDIELAVGRAYSMTYPWFFRVQRLPDGGLHGAPGFMHGFEAANEPRLEQPLS